MKHDTLVNIKFDTNLTILVLRWTSLCSFFRESEIPVTGSTTYETVADGFTADTTQ